MRLVVGALVMAAVLALTGCGKRYAPPMRTPGSVLIHVVDEDGQPLTGALCYPMATTNDPIFVTGAWAPYWWSDKRGFAAPASVRKPILCVHLQGYSNRYITRGDLSTDGTNTVVLKRRGQGIAEQGGGHVR